MMKDAPDFMEYKNAKGFKRILFYLIIGVPIITLMVGIFLAPYDWVQRLSAVMTVPLGLFVIIFGKRLK